jgi:hypothetical protein
MNQNSKFHIHFYTRKRLTQWPDVDSIKKEDIPNVQQRFRTGIDVWIIQSYIFLSDLFRKDGHRVTIGNEIPYKSIIIAHSDDLNRFNFGIHNSFIIGIRADRSPLFISDIEILQNDLSILKNNQFYIHSWPQPGIIHRSKDRGINVNKVAYFGRKDSLPLWLSSDEFILELTNLGVEFEVRHNNWNDYSDVDLVLAHRIEAPTMLNQKPATKLTNSWLAGVPALLSPEPAYCGMRKSAEDFIEVNSAEDVIKVVRNIKSDYVFYQSLLDRAAKRGKEFTEQKITEQWLNFFNDSVFDYYIRWSDERKSMFRYIRNFVKQKHHSKKFKKAVAIELDLMHAPPPIRS